MNAFTIKDLEKLSGIKAHTIRIWEQRYTFIKPQRTQTNIRYYTSEELKTILNIALLNKYGFKISHINRMSPDEMREKILQLGNIQAQQERIVNTLIHNMVDLELDKFENQLDNYILARGIEKTITHIIFPFLERIGILWLTNHINPAQEHLVTNIIRQKLIVGIESTVSHINIDKTVLLFMPEGEHHEIGLLFIYYLLKSRGVKTLYLGADVPMKDVEFIVNAKKPDYIYTHITTSGQHLNLDRFINNISMRLTAAPVIISGQVIQGYKKAVSSNIQFKYSLAEVMEYIATL